MNDLNYYLIEPVITERTPLLMDAGAGNFNGIDFLYQDTTVADDYVAHLRFLMPLKNPDMNTDFLNLEGYAVFSGKVCNALMEHMPINNLQLVKAVINENGEEYKDFWIANVFRNFLSFNEELSQYEEIDEEKWYGIEQVILDKIRLSKIPLKERLVYEATEDCAFTLYHESVVDIIKSVEPKGMQFIPIEEWRS